MPGTHDELIVIDGTNPSLFDESLLFRMKMGGVTAVNVTISIFEDFEQTCLAISQWKALIADNEQTVMHVLTVDDIHRAKFAKKLGIIFGFQNTAAIGEHVELLPIFHALGVRVIQLTYNERNYVGDGCLERADGGLSHFGLRVVRQMNELGILIDLSHVGHQTTIEAINVSQKPVAFTHANPKALLDHPRCKTNEELSLLASKGGVVGATFWPYFLRQGMNATLADFLDVIDYLVDIVGESHVSIASDFFFNRQKDDLRRLRAGRGKPVQSIDFPWPPRFPDGIRQPEEFPNITEGLLSRGYSAEAVAKIMGGNLCRLFEEVWKTPI